MKRTILFLTLYTLVGSALPGWAQKVQCSLSGWVEDKNKSGTKIRATPSTKGKVVKVFPFPKEDGEQAMLDIVGYSSGWLKVRYAETVDGSELLKNTAWISAKLITASVETNTGKPATLYATPSRKGRKVGTIPNETLITIVGFDCFGYKVAYKGRSGWLSREDTCGNPVTTCP